MSNGFFTILLLQLSVKYWYFVVISLAIKYFLVRFMGADSTLKAVAMWTTGTVCFYAFACLGGFLFSFANIYLVPFLMFASALTIESVLCTLIFHTEGKRIFFPICIGDLLLFCLLFFQVSF
jgi:hypothetical protein